MSIEFKLIHPSMNIVIEVPMLQRYFNYELNGITESPFGLKRYILTSSSTTELIIEDASIYGLDLKPYFEIEVPTIDDFSDISMELSDFGLQPEDNDILDGPGCRVFYLGSTRIVLICKDGGPGFMKGRLQTIRDARRLGMK